jgi:hypothetical protein
MLSTALESLRFEFIVVFSPLILKMVKLVNIEHHHVISFDIDSCNVLIFSNAEAGAERDHSV